MMSDDEIIKNETQTRLFTLKAHDQRAKKGLTDNHVMAYFDEGGISPMVDFINAWEMNAKIFSIQILRYLKKVDDPEKRKYVKELAQEAYNMLSTEHYNIAIMSRNKKDNFLMQLIHQAEAGDESAKSTLDNIQKAMKPKEEGEK